MKEVLTQFLGDAIEVDDDAALTWMIKLTITWDCIVTLLNWTCYLDYGGYLHLKHSETGADWLNLLKSGGSKTPP